MQGAAFNLDDLSGVCVEAFPPFDQQEQRVVIATYRALALGEPVSAQQIGRSIDAAAEDVQAALLSWNSLARFDREGRVVGFLGLDLSPSTHRFETNGRTLYTWCAWDTLFIPRVLGQAARVHSVCPVSGQAIRLLSTPDGVSDLDPPGTMVSFVTPKRARLEADIIASFCCYVHFLASTEAADQWMQRHRGSLILTIEEAWALGRICVRTRLPSA